MTTLTLIGSVPVPTYRLAQACTIYGCDYVGSGEDGDFKEALAEAQHALDEHIASEHPCRECAEEGATCGGCLESDAESARADSWRVGR